MTKYLPRIILPAVVLLGLPILWYALLPSEVFADGFGEYTSVWPSREDLLRVLTLQDYNTRVVITGTTLLGMAAGLVGTFLLLRKRALLSDTLSHASLPGIALMFIVLTATSATTFWDCFSVSRRWRRPARPLCGVVIFTTP